MHHILLEQALKTPEYTGFDSEKSKCIGFVSRKAEKVGGYKVLFRKVGMHQILSEQASKTPEGTVFYAERSECIEFVARKAEKVGGY